MKKLIQALALLLFSMTAACAQPATLNFNQYVTGLPTATVPLASTNSLYVLQGGVSKQVSVTGLFTNPALTFGTGSTESIVANSVNPGFANQIIVSNSSAGNNSIAAMLVNLPGISANAFLAYFIDSNTGTLSAAIQSGSAITGGFTISALAGTLNLTGPITFVPTGAGAAAKYVCVDASNNVLTQAGAC